MLRDRCSCGQAAKWSPCIDSPTATRQTIPSAAGAGRRRRRPQHVGLIGTAIWLGRQGLKPATSCVLERRCERRELHYVASPIPQDSALVWARAAASLCRHARQSDQPWAIRASAAAAAAACKHGAPAREPSARGISPAATSPGELASRTGRNPASPEAWAFNLIVTRPCLGFVPRAPSHGQVKLRMLCWRAMPCVHAWRRARSAMMNACRMPDRRKPAHCAW